jgi:hypothetical protein
MTSRGVLDTRRLAGKLAEEIQVSLGWFSSLGFMKIYTLW